MDPTSIRQAFDFRTMIADTAARLPEKDFLVLQHAGTLKKVTFSAFQENVRALCEAFFEMDIAGKSVAVIGETSPQWIETYLAVILAGGVIVPLDKELSAEAVVGFINKVGCTAVVYSEKFATLFDEQAGELEKTLYRISFSQKETDAVSDDAPALGVSDFEQWIAFGKKLVTAGADRYDTNPTDMEKVCAILFTSGTTGTSKGVMLCQKNLISAINGSYCLTQFEEEDVVVSVLPIHHTYEMTCGILTPLFMGATVCINPSLKTVLRSFQQYKPTGLVLVPLFVTTIHKKIWETARKTGKERFLKTGIALSSKMRRFHLDPRRLLFKEVQALFGGRLKRIICGGAAMSPELVAEFEAFGIALCQGYGITECAPLISVCPEKGNRAGSVGVPIPGLAVKIEPEEEEDGKEIGEILVRGPSVMKGYFDDKQATDEVMRDGWFCTGDYGYIDDDGYIFITGRKKNVIVLENGKNVFPEEIEEYLDRIDLVKECVVVGRKGEDGGVLVNALIYPDFALASERGLGEDLSAIGEAIRKDVAALNRTLPSFKQIRGVEMRRTEFEKTTSQKIIRYKIR